MFRNFEIAAAAAVFGFLTILDAITVVVFAKTTDLLINGAKYVAVPLSDAQVPVFYATLAALTVIGLRFPVAWRGNIIFFKYINGFEKLVRDAFISEYITKQITQSTREQNEFVSNAVIWSQAMAIQIVAPVIKLMSEVLLIFLILSFLLIFEKEVFFQLLPIMGAICLIAPLIFLFRSNVAKNISFADLQQQIVDKINHIVSNKELLVLDSSAHSKILDNVVDNTYVTIKTQMYAAGRNPRVFVETIGYFGIIAALSYGTFTESENTYLTYLIGITIRILPSVTSYMVLVVNFQYLKDIYWRSNDLFKNRTVRHSFAKQNFEKIHFKDVRLIFNSTKLFDGLNFTISKGDRVIISGPSGSGKTSLVKVLAGIQAPSSGYVTIDGKNISSPLTDLISISIQRPVMVGGTIKDNVFFDDKIDDPEFNRACSRLNLSDLSDCNDLLSYNLSGGQLQRISLLRTIFSGAKILVFDEPTSAQDSYNKKQIINLIDNLDFDLTIIVISHDGHLLERFSNWKKITL